jgi:hypothetical protein
VKKFASAIFVFAFAVAASVLANNSATDNAAVSTTAVKANVSGLDLQALSALAKQAHDAPELERLLNEEGSINNLDLDGDGYVDYIRVVEYKSGDVRGFKLLDGDQEVARIEVERTSSGAANIVLEGTQAVYGYGEDYYLSWQSSWDEYPLFSWLWMPRATLYVSPWNMSFYPQWYRHYRPVPWGMYAWRTRRHNWYRQNMDRHHGYDRPGQNHRDQWRGNPHSSPAPPRSMDRNQTAPRGPRVWQNTPQRDTPRRALPSPQQRPRVSSPAPQAPRANQSRSNSSSVQRNKR